jgi:hypothetical protein
MPLLAGALLAGCGGSARLPAPIAPGAGAALRARVQAIRSAAEAHKPARAKHAVGALEAEVLRLSREGQLSRGDTQALLVLAGHADGRVAVEVHPLVPPPLPVTTTVTVTVPAPTPAPTPAPAAAPTGGVPAGPPGLGSFLHGHHHVGAHGGH